MTTSLIRLEQYRHRVGRVESSASPPEEEAQQEDEQDGAGNGWIDGVEARREIANEIEK
jgi:hypothetical protein